MQEKPLKLEDCECYELDQGRIFIGPSNEKQSIGYLELNPNQQLTKHNRPVDEELIQIEGTSVVRIFRSNSIEEVILLSGTTTKIPANKYHIHCNRTNKKSLTFWRFNGDITKIIEEIKKNNKKLTKI